MAVRSETERGRRCSVLQGNYILRKDLVCGMPTEETDIFLSSTVKYLSLRTPQIAWKL